jgi:formylmethanofuran--tetrahydromethanopterin N-formyltransferase
MTSGIAEIEDTYCEAFDGLYCRLLVTGERGLTEEDTKSPFLEYDPLRFAAYRATSTPSMVIGRPEAGIERWLKGEETPDGREGAILQFWGMYNENKSIEEQSEKFFEEVSIRIRQDILSASGGTTRIFDWIGNQEIIYTIDSKARVGDCGAGYESLEEEFKREFYKIPLMMGYDFKIDKNINIGLGISGANLWFFCDDVETGRRAGKRAIEAIKKVEGVITSFYICPSGSMAKNYKLIGPPTNYFYCPTLKEKIPDSKVPSGVKSIPEIVIDGVNLDVIKRAMSNAIKAVRKLEGVKKISAGNYGGKLGQYKIYLKKDLV